MIHSISKPGDGEAVGNAVVATLIACGTGGLVVLFTWKFLAPQSGRVWSLAKFINGCLAGMVSVCAACNTYYPWMSCLTASAAGFIYLIVSDIMVRLRIDDPLDAVAVHGGPGTVFWMFLIVVPERAKERHYIIEP